MLLTPPEAAALMLLREDGPQKLSMVNESAVDALFKRRPKLVSFQHHPDDPIVNITSEGLLLLADYEATQSTSSNAS